MMYIIANVFHLMKKLALTPLFYWKYPLCLWTYFSYIIIHNIAFAISHISIKVCIWWIHNPDFSLTMHLAIFANKTLKCKSNTLVTKKYYSKALKIVKWLQTFLQNRMLKICHINILTLLCVLINVLLSFILPAMMDNCSDLQQKRFLSSGNDKHYISLKYICNETCMLIIYKK